MIGSFSLISTRGNYKLNTPYKYIFPDRNTGFTIQLKINVLPERTVTHFSGAEY